MTSCKQRMKHLATHTHGEPKAKVWAGLDLGSVNTEPVSLWSINLPKGKENQAPTQILHSLEDASCTDSSHGRCRQTQAQFRKVRPTRGGSSDSIFLNTGVSSQGLWS